MEDSNDMTGNDSTTNTTSAIASYEKKFGATVQRLNTHIKQLSKLGINEKDAITGFLHSEVVVDCDKRFVAEDEDMKEFCSHLPLNTTQMTADKIIELSNSRGFAGLRIKQYVIGDDSSDD